MFSIERDAHGLARHLLTKNGFAAVALAIGVKMSGKAEGDSAHEERGEQESEEIMAYGLQRIAINMIERVAVWMGVSRHDAVRAMASASGAGWRAWRRSKLPPEEKDQLRPAESFNSASASRGAGIGPCVRLRSRDQCTVGVQFGAATKRSFSAWRRHANLVCKLVLLDSRTLIRAGLSR
jgi:hypothetical protein